MSVKVAIEGPREPGEHVAMFQLKHKKEFGEINGRGDGRRRLCHKLYEGVKEA